MLYRVGARVWIARIMITWGLVSAAMSFAIGPNSFYVLRFLLGAAEAGFFPGIAFYLSTWFPSEYRTRIIAWFMVAIPISAVIGGPVSGLLLAMDGIWGLAGWQWLFLVEGLPVVFVGLSVLRLLPDRPEDAAWLTDEDRRIVSERLQSERKPKEVRRLSVALTGSARVDSGWRAVRVSRRLVRHRDLPAADTQDAAVCPTCEIGFITSACYACASVGDDSVGAARGSRGRQDHAT